MSIRTFLHRVSASTAAIIICLAAFTLWPRAAVSQGSGRIAIRCGLLIDGTGAPARPGAVLLVEQGRIIDVVENSDVPEGFDTIDLSQYSVIPGLIDAHTHLFIRPGDPVPEQSLKESESLRTLYALRHAQALIESGFTTIRDLGTEGAGYGDVSVRKAIEAGLYPGPRILAATRGITRTGGADDRLGYSPDLALPSLSVTVDGAAEMRKAVREQIKFGADVIKVYATGGLTEEGDSAVQGLSFEELEVAVQEAGKQGRRVAAHADGGPGAHDAIRAGVVSIEHGDHLDEETLRMMVEAGTYWVPTPLILDTILEGDEGWTPAAIEKARRSREAFARAFRLALQLDVRIAYGTEAGGYFFRENARQMEIFVTEGMTPMQTLLSATSVAAGLLGLEGEIGTLEKGKAADIIAVRGNPLEDIRRLQQVRFVMKQGRIVLGDSIQPLESEER